METAFSNLKPGDKGHVLGYSEGNTPYRSKLLAMGLVPEVPFRVVRISPLGDPVEIQVNGFHLSLRKQEADLLRIEKEGA
ncbi:MAG: FeoA family protein [SAR324 cluster bacterium]|nr:FeoA family protein [SAR324 cluster bacterium]